MTFELPLRTQAGLNHREHWRARAARVKAERRLTSLVFAATWRRSLVAQRPCVPVDVALVRVSPGTRPMDDDNLPGSLKAVRDQLAEELGVDDGDRASIRFTYAQERGPWAVRVSIQERAP